MGSRGGAAPYRKGAAHERLVKAHYEQAGWFAIRSPQSGSAIDILAIPPQGSDECVHWVQAKTNGRIRPHERQAVVELAERYGGVPVLAFGSKPVCLQHLTTKEEIDLATHGAD